MEKSKKSLDRAAKTVAEQVDTQIVQPLTVLFDQLPAWLRDNQFILSGYRPATGSYWKSAASLGYLHNESVNIYSHLVGAILFLVGSFVTFVTLESRYDSADATDIYVFACFFVGAVSCLGMSATYHTISNHSHAVAKFGNKLDYLGIVALIWGSFIPSIYYGFACDPNLIKTYWAMITTMGAGCAVVSSKSLFRTPEWRPFRAGMFVALGLSAIIPVIHGLRLFGIQRMWSLIGLPWLVTQGTLYVIGAGIYAARFPERLKPGTFDIWFASHQIFHFLVVAAAAVHLIGLVKAFDYHHSMPNFVLCAGMP